MINKTNLPIQSLHANGGEGQTQVNKNTLVEMATRDKSITDIENIVMGGKHWIVWGSVQGRPVQGSDILTAFRKVSQLYENRMGGGEHLSKWREQQVHRQE